MRTTFHKRKIARIKWFYLILLIICSYIIYCMIIAALTINDGRNEEYANELDHLTNINSSPIIHSSLVSIEFKSKSFLSQISWSNTLNTIEMRDISKYNKIITVGDLHGDLDQAIKILTLTNIIDINQNWIANNTILIQTGDIVDRGSQSIFIYKLFLKLKAQCIKYNSLVFNQIGNHEHLQFINDFTYVNKQEINTYGGFDQWKKIMSIQSDIGKFLRNLPIARIIGTTLFVHAGILPGIAIQFENNITLLNEKFHETIMKDSIKNDINPIIFYQGLSPIEQSLVGINSPMWTRYFEPAYYDFNMLSDVFNYMQTKQNDTNFIMPENRQEQIKLFMCDKVNQLMYIYNVKRMIIGHNVQATGAVQIYCDSQLYAIDVGMSQFYGGNLAALEIDVKTDNVQIITDPNNPPHVLQPSGFGGLNMQALLFHQYLQSQQQG
eukprot:167027_1